MHESSLCAAAAREAGRAKVSLCGGPPANSRRVLRAAMLAAFLRPARRAVLRTGLLAGFLLPALGACAAIEQLVGTYGGGEGLALLKRAAEGVETVEDATIGNAVKVLPRYCVLPGAARSLFRARINGRAEAEGAQVGIWCPGDDPLNLGFDPAARQPFAARAAGVGGAAGGAEAGR